MTSSYVNPLAGATVTPERIDQGVDYAGTGTLLAIARGIVTKVLTGASSGWPGNYVQYQITQPGPLQGKYVYYAEGVTPQVKVGQTVNAGDTIATLIPGWSTGIEIGYASGSGSSSYAQQQGGGYTEGQATAAGQAFSDLIQSLGGPGGKLEAPQVTGTATGLPASTGSGSGGSGSGGSGVLQTAEGLPVVGGVVSGAASAYDTAKEGAQLVGDITNFVSNPLPTLLKIALVMIGASFIYEGAGRTLGFGSPIKSTATTAAAAATAVPEV